MSHQSKVGANGQNTKRQITTYMKHCYSFLLLFLLLENCEKKAIEEPIPSIDRKIGKKSPQSNLLQNDSVHNIIDKASQDYDDLLHVITNAEVNSIELYYKDVKNWMEIDYNKCVTSLYALNPGIKRTLLLRFVHSECRSAEKYYQLIRLSSQSPYNEDKDLCRSISPDAVKSLKINDFTKLLEDTSDANVQSNIVELMAVKFTGMCASANDLILLKKSIPQHYEQKFIDESLETYASQNLKTNVDNVFKILPHASSGAQQNAIRQMGAYYPIKSSEYILQQLNSLETAESIVFISAFSSGWAETDINSFASWANTSLHGIHKDIAMKEIVTSLRKSGSNDEAENWINSIEDPSIKKSVQKR